MQQSPMHHVPEVTHRHYVPVKQNAPFWIVMGTVWGGLLLRLLHLI